jgi:hypothetical protein
MTTEFTWTHERVDELRRLICMEHLSRAGAAQRLGVSKNAVVGKCQRDGIGLAPLRWKPAEATPNPFPDVPDCCLWPHGHPNEPGFHFCGGHRVPGKPYCPKHSAVAYDRRPVAAVETV